MGKNFENTKLSPAPDSSALTRREQEIFNKLLEGVIPKEIAHSLNISFNTFKTHQKNLYQKLGVNSIRELVAKYPAGQTEYGGGGAEINSPAVFTRWILNKDKLGSEIHVTEQIEQIEGIYYPTISMTGKLSPINDVYAGIYAIPDPSTLEIMKKMKRFSFKVLGDGNTYVVMIPTRDTRVNGEFNHYRKPFTTKNSMIETISINEEDLTQSPNWGSPLPFIKENIEFFQIHGYTTREFNLKFWDVRFYNK